VDAVPFPADRLPRDHTLRQALAAGLAGESTEPTEITVNGQSMMLTARALGDGGVVLAVFDLTASRRVEAVRRDFVANVSHELKTPLTVILGFAETLAAGDVSPAESTRFVEAIQTNAQRMQQIVDDLLDLSRIESGGWVPNPAMVDLRAVAGEVSAGRMRAANEKGVRLSVDLCAGAETAFADPTAIRQVYANLADNAIRHTNAGGSIVMFSERGERGTTIGVRDTGVGIAPEHLSRIFERFYRADSGRARDSGGTGLGLAIVRHLVEAHRGRVQVTSVVGAGTTVTAYFPDAA
jgi:two-component system, OmpR family, phosphate regulon sensor histidine kinase PhoR